MAEVYKINGQPLDQYMTHVQTLDGVVGVPPVRQTDFVVPGRTGVVAAKPWIGPRPISIGGLIVGNTRAQYLDNLRRLGKQVFNGGDTLTIERTLDLQGTISQFEDLLANVGGNVARRTRSVATARYLSGLDQVAQVSDRVGRAVMEFVLLDGYFYDENFTALSASSESSFSIEMPGDAPTQQVVVRFADGSDAQRLTNETTDDFVQYTGSTSTSVRLDVATFSATKNETNVIADVRSGTASYYWMRLNPGRNRMKYQGNGSVRVSYKAAYL